MDGVLRVIKFVIVDDKEEMQDQLKSIIRKSIFATDHSVEIKCFKKYNANLEKIIKDKSQRTIYLLDIDLDCETTGIDIALKIRQYDWDSEIIFLTCHDKYFEKVYRSIYKVFDFIEKFDNMTSRLTKDIQEILKQDYDTKMFRYSNRQIDLQLYLKDIMYIYRDTHERKLVIVTTNNQFMINKNIIDIIDELDNRFKQVHRSCIVNTNRVNLYKWNNGSFILDNKEEVFMLSKNFKDQIKNEKIKS